jgi:hypothetical protein
MRMLIRLTLSVFLLFAVSAYAIAGRPVNTYQVSGVDVTVLIPDGMLVEMIPSRVVTSNKMSRLRYTFTTREKEITHGLRWRVIVGDSEGNVISEDYWWDRGEWAAGSAVEATAVFEYDKKPGTKLVVVLERVANNIAVKSCSAKVTDAFLKQLFSGGGEVVLTTNIERQVPISEKDELFLLGRSLNTIVNSEDLKRDLGASEYSGYYLLSDKFDSLNNLPNFRPITKEQIKEKLTSGQPFHYFEYCCYETSGKVINIVINYHSPKPVGNLYLRKGTRLKFSFRARQGRFNLKGIATERL